MQEYLRKNRPFLAGFCKPIDVRWQQVYKAFIGGHAYRLLNRFGLYYGNYGVQRGEVFKSRFPAFTSLNRVEERSQKIPLELLQSCPKYTQETNTRQVNFIFNIFVAEILTKFYKTLYGNFLKI